MKNETQRAAISAIIDEIEQTQQMLGINVSQPSDREARQTVERTERRLRSVNINRPRPEGDNWVTLGDAAKRALKNLTSRKDGD